MNQEHNNIHINTFSKGADVDSEKEILCSQPTNGVFIDGHNCMPVSNDGNTGSIEKIKGEEIKYINNTGQTGYTCICSDSINDDLVEFWAPNTLGFPGIVRVNGVVVLESVDFDIRPEYPLQWDKNQTCIGGEIAITDNRVPPYLFSIKDMVDSLLSDPNKYFSAFDPLLYQINLQSPLDIPVFIQLINVGGGGGLPVGHYQYAMRYSSKDGDRTNWSQTTPMIPIVQSLSNDSEQYPWVKTYGGPPAPSSKTSLAPVIRFRVTNIYNYDFIEIKRIEYNAGAGIEFTPNGSIVAKIEIANQEISVRDYIDPSESNTDIALSAEDESQELVEVEAAKAIRYVDRRLVLMNVKLASKAAELTYKKINEIDLFPVIDNIGTAGYNDTWNHVYRKSYMRGEKFTFGTTLFDGVGTRGFTDSPDTFKNYQFPNRRDPISAETSSYSVNGTVKAATSQGDFNVGQTHEVFDLVNAVRKDNKCDFKNIIRSGKVLGLTGTKDKSEVTEECDETDAEIENHGARVSALNDVSTAYQPFTPVRQGDPDVEGHNYIATSKIAQNGQIIPTPGGEPPSGDQYDYTPRGFAPDYYAQGIVIPGVQNFPKWAKAFSIVRTNAAKRVVCQGLGYYSLVKGEFKFIVDDSLGGKEYNKLSFYSPDIENGIVSSDTVNDIIDNPQNYQLQFVSPLGFFSEWFSAEDKFSITNPQRDRCIDMISYVRMLRDDDSNDAQRINPFEDAAMGVTGGDGFNYVAYDKFRNIGSSSNVFNGSADKGNRIINLASVKRVAEGRGTFIELETLETIYANQFAGGQTESEFEDNGLKNWTEPVYIVNIVRIGAEVRDDNITKYKQTSHYQKLESIIGRSNGLAGQNFQLVDERWEDCIPDFSLVDRYIYIKKPDGSVDKWINVTGKTIAQIATIKNDILTLGSYTGNVKGIYTHANIDGKSREFEIILNDVDILAPADSLILVRYDDTAPIRVYGGDTYVGETIFAPIDNEAAAKDDEAEKQFAFGIGLPYKQFKINPRFYTIRKAGALVNVIQEREWFSLGFIRQLCVMFTVESRCAVHLAYNDATSPNQFFPLINYVIRPNRWDEDESTEKNGVFQEYVDDYGEVEKDTWKWGGFRFKQQINPDYSTEPRLEFFSRPDFGFEDKTDFCTRIMWSLPRAINTQNAPGLKTFPANNAFDIDDDQGEIKRAWDATGEKGENLYAFTNNGICLLITKKSILSDLNAGELGYMAADSFIKAQYWLTKDTGMTDEYWRSAAEAFVSMVGQDGSEIRKEAIFFANNESIFRFMDNSAIDIGRIKYHSKLYKQGLKNVLPSYGTKMTAIYNKYLNQYWLLIQGSVNKLFVFGQRSEMWYGTNAFRFDSFSVRGNETFGHRDLQTWELGKGYIINGQPVSFELTFGSAPEQFFDKEFTRIRINSPQTQKPTRVEFYKEVSGAVQCALDASIPEQGALFMKDYGGFEAFVPRIDAVVDVNRKRFQQRIIITKILHNLSTEFKVIDASVSYKLIK